MRATDDKCRKTGSFFMERPGGRGQGREKWRIKRNSKNLRIDPESPNREILGKYGLICENSREMFISIDHCIIHASADRGGPGWWISDKADVFALWSAYGTVVGCIVHIRKIGNKCKIYV